MRTEKHRYTFPVVLAAAHTLVVALLTVHCALFPGGEEEELWEYAFFFIDLPAYLLVGVPHVVDARGIVAFGVYFAIMGAVQWGFVGLCIHWLVSWQSKQERGRTLVHVLLWLTPLWSGLLFAVARWSLIAGGLGDEDIWLALSAHVPVLAVVLSLCLRRWWLVPYCAGTAVLAFWFGS